VGSHPQFALAEWWGLVEGDPLLVGLVVAVVAGFAVTYMILRRRRGD
jgi:hypothetical protein